MGAPVSQVVVDMPVSQILKKTSEGLRVFRREPISERIFQQSVDDPVSRVIDEEPAPISKETVEVVSVVSLEHISETISEENVDVAVAQLVVNVLVAQISKEDVGVVVEHIVDAPGQEGVQRTKPNKKQTVFFSLNVCYEENMQQKLFFLILKLFLFKTIPKLYFSVSAVLLFGLK